MPHRAHDAIDESDAVFTGVVERVEVVGSPSTEGDPYGKHLTYAGQEATIRVRMVWKGIAEPVVTVTTPFDEAQCGYDFLAGKEYLVYATRQDRLTTTSCTRTRLVAQADDDFLALGDGSPMTTDYQAMIKRCDVEAMADCCLASVQRMSAGQYQLAPPAGCPRGLQTKSLACQGSHRWCEPSDEAR